MPKVQTLQDLTRLREAARQSLSRRERTGTVIAIGMGSCGMAAGARETMDALQEELDRRQIQVQFTTVGCIGMCAREPLVEIRQAGVSRILYGNITAQMVGRLVEEHLVNGRPVKQWIVGRMSTD